jgi:tRNA pseudouridine38-40 synthase
VISISITADGFLYNMVRSIVGTLVEIGQGRRPRTDLERILAARDRSQAGATAPPQGLYLMSVTYGD